MRLVADVRCLVKGLRYNLGTGIAVATGPDRLREFPELLFLAIADLRDGRQITQASSSPATTWVRDP